MGTYVYLCVKYFKNVLKYKYLSIITYRYLSTITQVHEQYLSMYLSTDVLKYSSSLSPVYPNLCWHWQLSIAPDWND